MKKKISTFLVSLVLGVIQLSSQELNKSDEYSKAIATGLTSTNKNEIRNCLKIILKNRNEYGTNYSGLDYNISFMYYKIGESENALKNLVDSQEKGNELALAALYLKMGKQTEAIKLLRFGVE